MYAAVEIWFVEIARRFVLGDRFLATPVALTLAFAASYVAVAALLGAIAAAVIRAAISAKNAATAALLVALIANLLVHLHGSVVPTLATAIGCLVLVTSQSRFAPSSWAASLLIVAPDFVANDLLFQEGYFARGAAFVVAVAVVGALSILGRRVVVHRAIGIAIALLSIAIACSLTPPARADLPPPAASAEPGAPNVLLVTMDTVRADHLSCYGYDRNTTPFLTGFAKRATKYERAIAPSNMTLATHASLFTGLSASQHGAHSGGGWYRPLPRGIPTIGQIFRRRGYDVSSVAANYVFLDHTFGLDRGFTHLESLPAPNPLASLETKSMRRSHLLRYPLYALLKAGWPRFGVARRWRENAEITRLAEERIDDAERMNRPFFLFVNYLDAHSPYVPSPAYAKRFLPRSVSPQEVQIARYDGAIASADAEVGLLIRALEQRGLLDRTIVVITSDHGDAFSEHETYGHGSTPYDEQVRVPLIIRMPGSHAAVVVSDPVSLTDVFTLLTVSKAVRASEPVTESFSLETTPPPGIHARSGRAIYSGRFKLFRPFDGADELYDLIVDPHELKNLATIRPDVVASLSVKLNVWSQSRGSPVLPPVLLTDEARRRLRSLGYLH